AATRQNPSLAEPQTNVTVRNFHEEEGLYVSGIGCKKKASRNRLALICSARTIASRFSLLFWLPLERRSAPLHDFLRTAWNSPSPAKIPACLERFFFSPGLGFSDTPTRSRRRNPKSRSTCWTSARLRQTTSAKFLPRSRWFLSNPFLRLISKWTAAAPACRKIPTSFSPDRAHTSLLGTTLPIGSAFGVSSLCKRYSQPCSTRSAQIRRIWLRRLCSECGTPKI